MKNKNFKIIIDGKKSASDNMQIDDSLVKLFLQDEVPIFRLYEWEKSFSVGLNQHCDDYKVLLKSCNNNCYQRITGGGVLLHGHDISYSIVLARKNYISYSVKEVYEMICQFIIDFYKSLGFDAKLAKYLEGVHFSKSDFCQVGIEANDIIINNKKVGGNAQKWTKDVIFQHGSIPISKPLFKEEMGGISLEELGISISVQEAKQQILQSFYKCYKVDRIV